MITRTVVGTGKGWFTGPWESGVPVALGYATSTDDDPHVHGEMYEIYLVASGTSTAVVEERTVELHAGDMLVVEPGETHTFTGSSRDYLHFVVQTPFVPGDRSPAHR